MGIGDDCIYWRKELGLEHEKHIEDLESWGPMWHLSWTLGVARLFALTKNFKMKEFQKEGQFIVRDDASCS